MCLSEPGVARRVSHDDAHRGAAGATERDGDEVVEAVNADDVLVLRGQVQRRPFLMARRRDRGDRELEVGAARVVHDEELVADGLDVVLDALAPLGHDARRPEGIRGVEDAVLVRRLRADADDDEPVVARGAHPDEEALVGLVVDEHVGRGRRAHLVAPDLVGPPGSIHAV